MHLHEVLKIEISFHAQSCTFIRPCLNSAHIGVACPLFFYTPLLILINAGIVQLYHVNFSDYYII